MKCHVLELSRIVSSDAASLDTFSNGEETMSVNGCSSIQPDVGSYVTIRKPLIYNAVEATAPVKLPAWQCPFAGFTARG